MSADNWTRCPRCLKAAYDISSSRRKAAEEAYGKVSSQEYLRLLTIANEDFSIDVTLREDYELGIITDRDIFYVSYSASCTYCNFTYSFSKEERLNEIDNL